LSVRRGISVCGVVVTPRSPIERPRRDHTLRAIGVRDRPLVFTLRKLRDARRAKSRACIVPSLFFDGLDHVVALELGAPLVPIVI
jgi:hypothetical protein